MTAGDYATALAATVMVESAVYAIGLPRLGPASTRAAAVAGLLVNLASHPVAWLALWPVLNGTPGFVVVETLVCIGEWAALRRWRPFDGPLLVALVLLANAASLGAGVVVDRL